MMMRGGNWSAVQARREAEMLELMKHRLAVKWIRSLVDGSESVMCFRPELPSFYELWDKMCQDPNSVPVFRDWLTKQGLNPDNVMLLD